MCGSLVRFWNKLGEWPARAPKPPPTLKDRINHWRILLGLGALWQIAIAVVILILRFRVGGTVGGYGIYFCIAYIILGVALAVLAVYPRRLFLYGHALVSLFLGLAYIATIIIVFATAAPTDQNDSFALSSFGIYLPGAIGMMLPSILTYLAYRKFLVFEWEQVNQQAQNQPAAVAAPAPPVLVHVDGYHAPVGQNDPADVGAGASAGSDEESGEQESSSHSEAHPGAGAGAGVAEDLSASESSNLCCICMANPKNSVIYRCGHIATCYGCGQTLMRNGQSCPICRQRIVDVIKSYKV